MVAGEFKDLFDKWTQQKSPLKNNKDPKQFSIIDVKKGKVKKWDIVSKLSKVGTLEPITTDHGTNKRKGSGFRKSLTSDIDELSMSASSKVSISSLQKKTIPKVRDLIPFYSEFFLFVNQDYTMYKMHTLR